MVQHSLAEQAGYPIDGRNEQGQDYVDPSRPKINQYIHFKDQRSYAGYATAGEETSRRFSLIINFELKNSEQQSQQISLLCARVI